MLKTIKVSGIIVVILLLLPFFVGCSSSKNNNTPNLTEIPTAMPTVTPSTLSVEEAGAAFLDSLNTINSAFKNFQSKAVEWTSDTTSAQAVADAEPFRLALDKWETELTTTNWPAVAQADIRTLTKDIGQLVATLQIMETVNVFNVNSWMNSFASAYNAVKVDCGWVRHDLGLPPAQ